MKVVAVYHIKGGVGKTATSVNLAWCAAQSGKRTLLCDLDPQGSATFYFRIKPTVKGGMKPLLKRKANLEKHLKGTDYSGLDLLPADFSFRNLDLALGEAGQPRKRLREALKPLKDDFDLVFLDCPPNLTLLTENIMRAADAILCPVIPTPLSQRTLDQLREFLKENDYSTRLWPFFSMVERRKALHRDLMEELEQTVPDIMPVSIPYLSAVERMGVHREPVGVTTPNSPAAKAYHTLYRELDDRLLRL